MKIAFRLTAWAALLFIAFATLGPIGIRPHPIESVKIEHFVAFLTLGLLFAAAYPKHIWWVVASLVVRL